MLKGLMKKLHKTVTILMCVLLVVESINCAELVVNATEGSGNVTVTSGDVTEGKGRLYLLKHSTSNV